MLRFNRLEEIESPLKKAVVTIGNFDGVHIGHQSLFHAVIERADAIGGTSVAMTFDPHPIRVLKQNGNPPLITLHEQKVELIANTGIDVLITVPFNSTFAALTPREFVTSVLLQRIGMHTAVVGRDYTFGKGGQGNLETLRALAAELNFEVIEAGWINITVGSGERISSTRIRELVTEGEVAKVPRFLGRNYQIRGTVATGRNRGGRLLGFPTANINLADELCPKTGVYAVTVETDAGKFKGVANIGYSPTFDDHLFTVEVHILDFSDDIYGKPIRVNFIQRIRDEIKFDGIEQLAEQIRRDIEAAEKMLSV
jgi:riboflavin kinase/FMN adenylyltransferase